jgi:hypothetical protein
VTLMFRSREWEYRTQEGADVDCCAVHVDLVGSRSDCVTATVGCCRRLWEMVGDVLFDWVSMEWSWGYGARYLRHGVEGERFPSLTVRFAAWGS